MKVLLTNNHLNTYGGSETWVITVYEELIALGFDVDVFTFHADDKGASSEIDQDDLLVGKVIRKRYDLAIVNHQTCLKAVYRYFDVDHIRYVCHGIYPAIEQPLELAQSYVAISEEVKAHLAGKGFNSQVIHNPVNLERYYPKTDISEIDRISILSMCQSMNAWWNLIKLGYPIYSIKHNRAERGAMSLDRFDDANLVVGLGRSAFEGLACGRAVLVYDERSYNAHGCYDGMITKENIESLLMNNCSGRRNNLKFDEKVVDLEIKAEYKPSSEYYRSIAEKHFDSKKIVQQLLDYK